MRSLIDLPLKSLMAVALLGAVPGLVAAQEQKNADKPQAQSSGQDENSNQGQDKQEQEKDEVRTLKAFDLEHAKPQEMVTLIQTISARQHQAEMNRKAKEQAEKRAEKQERDPSQAATVPNAPQRTQVQFRPYSAIPQQNRLAVAVDEESKTLFVRGTSEQVSGVEKLVETFDTESGKLEKQEIDGVTLVPVKHDRLQQINTILSQLQLQTQALRVGDTAVLILPDDEERAKQAEQVIARLMEKSSESATEDEEADSDN